jgi:hypothetical protein
MFFFYLAVMRYFIENVSCRLHDEKHQALVCQLRDLSLEQV